MVKSVYDVQNELNQRLQQAQNRKELELSIIKSNLQRSEKDQILEIEKSTKFELENIRSEVYSELETKM